MANELRWQGRADAEPAAVTGGPRTSRSERAVAVSRAWWLEQASALSSAEHGAGLVVARAARARLAAVTEGAVTASRGWWREQASAVPATASDGWWRPQATATSCPNAVTRPSQPTVAPALSFGAPERVLASIPGGSGGE
jgi:hypothetical protein